MITRLYSVPDLNSGEVPDLFLSSAYSDNTLYADYIYNLDDEEFMKNFSETTLHL